VTLALVSAGVNMSIKCRLAGVLVRSYFRSHFYTWIEWADHVIAIVCAIYTSFYAIYASSTLYYFNMSRMQPHHRSWQLWLKQEYAVRGTTSIPAPGTVVCTWTISDHMRWSYGGKTISASSRPWPWTNLLTFKMPRGRQPRSIIVVFNLKKIGPFCMTHGQTDGTTDGQWQTDGVTMCRNSRQ